MNKLSRLRRRDLLRIGAVGAAGAATAALAGCGETQVVEVVKEVPVEKVKEVVKEVPVESEKIVTKIVERIVTVEVAPRLRSVTLTGWTFAHPSAMAQSQRRPVRRGNKREDRVGWRFGDLGQALGSPTDRCRRS